MNGKINFKARIQDRINEIGPERFAYDESEFWMIERPYEYVEFYAYEHQLPNTAVALPLARALHNGVHRKAKILKDGVAYRLPYVYHCLMVCRMLIDLQAPFSAEEEDILLAAALCHDMIEDVPFENGGHELTDVYGLDPRVYEIVKLVSKRKDFTEEEHKAYFKHIMENPFSLLVKLSDRSNNVEDLYNMSFWKAREYVEETRSCFFPMCDYGRAHYADLLPCVEFLYEKINALTLVTEVLINRYEKKEMELVDQVAALQNENLRLRAIMKEL